MKPDSTTHGPSVSIPVLKDFETNSAVRRVLDALQGEGCAPRKNGRGWQARCPTHHDRHPSLSLVEGREGRVLLRCWAGCDTGAVLQALGLRWPDLFAVRRVRTNRLP